jgi:hypothetical protein
MPTIKPSIGTSTANCYVTEASANSYFDVHFNSQAWDNLDGSTNATAVSNQKQALLIQATRELDRTFRFFDHKYNTGERGQDDYQALEFPRSTDYDSSSNLYIQDDVKYATYEQALWILMRTKPRRSEDDTILTRSIVGQDAYNYLLPYVNRQAKPSGNYIWQ